MNKEKREIFFNTKIEIRTDEAGNKTKFVGFIPYNSISNYMGFFEEVKKGAFTKSIQEADIKCLVNHNTDKVLGSSRAGSLTFEDTDEGLYFFCDIPYKRDFAVSTLDVIESGDADGVSFGFQVVKETNRQEQDKSIRELREVKLFEVSLAVAFPAYPESVSHTRDNEPEKEPELNIAEDETTFEELFESVETAIEAVKNSEKKPSIDSEERITNVISDLQNLIPEKEEEARAVDTLVILELQKRKLELLK